MSADIAPKLGRRFTLPQAARYLGMTTRQFEGIVRRGGIVFHRSGPRAFHYFYEFELDAHLTATRVEPTAQRAVQRAVDVRPRRSIAHLMPAVRELR